MTLKSVLNCETLRKFEVSDSALRYLPVNLFKGCKQLKYIDLSKNTFLHLPQAVRECLNELSTRHQVRVDLSDNMYSVVSVIRTLSTQ